MNNTSNSEHWFHIQGSHCGGCKKKIERVLGDLERVKAVDMNVSNNRLRVNGDVEPELIVSSLQENGFTGHSIGSGVSNS